MDEKQIGPAVEPNGPSRRTLGRGGAVEGLNLGSVRNSQNVTPRTGLLVGVENPHNSQNRNLPIILTGDGGERQPARSARSADGCTSRPDTVTE